MAPQHTMPARSTISGRAHFGQSRGVNPILRLQGTDFSPVEQQRLDANTTETKRASTTSYTPSLGHDFSRISVFAQHHESWPAATQSQFKTWGSAGGLSGLTLDVTFSVSDTPATSLQAIQTFMGTRRTDGLQVGTYSWQHNG